MSSHLQRRAILAYHEVMPNSDYAYCVPERKFREQMQLLSVQNESGVNAQVTFDDGERSEKEIAGAVLAELGIKATYFITPGLIGTAHKFLGWDELRELQAAGHSVQSHGWSHKFLTACSEGELRNELRMSKQRYRRSAGQRGRRNLDTRRALEHSGAARVRRCRIPQCVRLRAVDGIGNVRSKSAGSLHGAQQYVIRAAGKSRSWRSGDTAQDENAVANQERHCQPGWRRSLPPAVVPADRVQRI